MRHRTVLAIASTGALALGAAACGSSGDGGSGGGATSASSSDAASTSTQGAGGATINGAGSTLALPVYQTWASQLKGQGVNVNYQGAGSGAGVAQLQAGTAAFAGSDPALKPEDAQKLKGTPIQIPPFFGGITISYTLSGIKSGLKLDGKTIADIYLGKVKRWNDPEIASQNPGVQLPASAITVVHRSDSSGTTQGFTTFLSAHSPTWKSRYGADKTINWPLGTGAQGNQGIAAQVKQTQGSIGYVEQAYALQNGFTYAAVKNSSGRYVVPTLASLSQAGSGIRVPGDLAISTINSPNPQAYPITSQTFVITVQDLCTGAKLSKAQAQGLVRFLDFGLSSQGQSVASRLSYAPLPPSLLSKAQAQVKKLRCDGQPIASS